MTTRDWRPTANRKTLELRASLMQEIRDYFASRNVLEVETPALSASGTTDTALEALSVMVTSLPGKRGFLHTSPEFAMKRLLASGSGDIYQICRVFRDGEAGRWHEPEFTLLEWYRIGWDDYALMDEVGELCIQCLGPQLVKASALRLSYTEAFEKHLGVGVSSDEDALEAALASHGIEMPEALDRRNLLDLALGAAIVPALPRDRLIYIFDFPADQAALARLKDSNPQVAARFEVFINGIELANGFAELTDAEEQRARFDAETMEWARAGREAPPIDEDLLAALAHGLPECAGVAVGIDRLVAIAAGLEHIGAAISFAHHRS